MLFEDGFHGFVGKPLLRFFLAPQGQCIGTRRKTFKRLSQFCFECDFLPIVFFLNLCMRLLDCDLPGPKSGTL